MASCMDCIYKIAEDGGITYCFKKVIDDGTSMDTTPCDKLLNESTKEFILAIDPGNTESAYVFADVEDLKPIAFGKVPNTKMLEILNNYFFLYNCIHFPIEMIKSYGMPVGDTVFETCVWVGRFTERASLFDVSSTFIYRKSDVCQEICHSSKAKDSNIRQALINRFAQHDFKNGRGTKNNPDWFFGFKADIWQAYAVLVTYYEKYYKTRDTGD